MMRIIEDHRLFLQVDEAGDRTLRASRLGRSLLAWHVAEEGEPLALGAGPLADPVWTTHRFEHLSQPRVAAFGAVPDDPAYADPRFGDVALQLADGFFLLVFAPAEEPSPADFTSGPD